MNYTRNNNFLQIKENYTRHHRIIIIMLLLNVFIEITLKYCLVIKEAKRIEHEKLILNSYNKIKTPWGL